MEGTIDYAHSDVLRDNVMCVRIIKEFISECVR